jgi:hypothetical protein
MLNDRGWRTLTPALSQRAREQSWRLRSVRSDEIEKGPRDWELGGAIGKLLENFQSRGGPERARDWNEGRRDWANAGDVRFGEQVIHRLTPCPLPSAAGMSEVVFRSTRESRDPPWPPLTKGGSADE